MSVQSIYRETKQLSDVEIFKYLPDGNVLSESVVIDPATVAADGAGDKILKKGTFIVKITSGGTAGEFGPYLAGATDGRQTPTPPAGGNPNCGILSDDVDVTRGSKAIGMYWGNCQFIAAKLTLLGYSLANTKTAIPLCSFQ
jgi:hypothetical protein